MKGSVVGGSHWRVRSTSRSGGRAPSGVQGQSPWSGGGAKPHWSWKHFGHWMSNGAGKFSPFPKMSFRTSLHATKSLTTAESSMQSKRSLWTDYGFINNNGQRIYYTENSMLCYGPLVSELGAQSAWCPQPRHWGPVPPPASGSAAYACILHIKPQGDVRGG